MRKSMLWARSIPRLAGVVIVLGASTAFWTLRHDQAHAFGPPSWAPGVVAQVSSMSRVPHPASPPAGLALTIERVANRNGANAQQATASLRQLRAGVGSAGESLYGFSLDGASVCLMFWDRGVVCPTSPSSTTPGVIFDFSPGGPGYPGQSANLPAVVAGLVADNVAAVTVAVNGISQDVRILNNTFFAELGRIPDSGPWALGLTFTFQDGTTRHVEIPDPRNP
jgi:hypothetical protein